jgi:hypothetical protein
MGWTGELPAGPAPFARLTVDNASGTKLDLYLRRTVSYALGPCSHGVRTSTVTVTLTSDVPAVRLPPYVVRRHDVPASLTAAPLGSNRLLVYLHLTRGAGLDDATLDGRRIAVNTGNEQGHPVVALSLDLDRGQTRTLVLRLVEPATAGAPTVPVQPLAQPQHTTVVAAACRLSG